MMSHDLARKLLALDNHEMSGYYEGGEPKVGEEIDPGHPDYKPFDGGIELMGEANSPEWRSYWDSMPKKTVITD